MREFIDANQPEYFFCGHIHEAAGTVIQMGATRAQNVGKKGYLLDFDQCQQNQQNDERCRRHDRVRLAG